MARTPRLSPRFLARRTALGIVKRSPESRAIAATIVALCTSETLPGPGDAMTILEPADARGVAVLAHVRRVRGLNFWIWYREKGDLLEIARLTDRPPGTETGGVNHDDRSGARPSPLFARSFLAASRLPCPLAGNDSAACFISGIVRRPVVG